MKFIPINNTNDLIAFLKRPETTPDTAVEVLRSTIGVFAYPEDKDLMIRKTEAYVKKWMHLPITDRPFWLNQIEDGEFDIGIMYGDCWTDREKNDD
jgi:hypothetical protein